MEPWHPGRQREAACPQVGALCACGSCARCACIRCTRGLQIALHDAWNLSQSHEEAQHFLPSEATDIPKLLASGQKQWVLRVQGPFFALQT